LRFRIDGLPPSDNHIYRSGRGKGRYLTKEAKEWKDAVRYNVLMQPLADRLLLKEHSRLPPLDFPLFSLTIYYHMKLFTKAGEIRRWDVTNYSKITVDALTDQLGFDDRLLSTACLGKIHLAPNGREGTEILIEPIMLE
jgi:Holliday junction resolvase RusA-like endonuclease